LPGFFESSRDPHPNSFQLDLNLSNWKEELVDSGEYFHEVLGENQVKRPRDMHFEGKIAPVVPVVIGRLADHLPLLNLSLAVEVLDIGQDADVRSIHF
jgi:hypothetical protein